MTHDQLQAACWAWAWQQSVKQWPWMLRRFFSIPNSATGFMGRNKTMQLRACGLLSGVWDMPVYDQRGATHWLEFKIGSDRVKVCDANDDQWKFYLAMQPLGNQFFYEVRDFETFCIIFTAIAQNNQEALQKHQITVDK